MIIPTPEFDPLFADDGIPFSRKMCQYIQREFADQLGLGAALLETESGLEIVADKFLRQFEANDSQRDAA